MKRFLAISLLVLVFFPAVYGQVITEFASGTLSWTNTVNTAAWYRVEWAAGLDDTWTPLAGAGGPSFDGLRAVSNSHFSAQVPMFFRVSMITNPPAADMVLVPSGTFQMGDAFSEGFSSERPVHPAYINAFWIGRSELTYGRWNVVYQWAITNGYTFEHAGQGNGSNHPVHSVSWFDAVKWCNARSEMESRTPCYYSSSSTTVYRTGNYYPPASFVRWLANGYRLPTEAEWEHAARGGVNAKRFPWGDTISFERANYNSLWQNGHPYNLYDIAYTNGSHPVFADGSEPFTAEGTPFPANAYGLCNMAGNLNEWVWDWYSTSYYSSAPLDNPKGLDGIGVNKIYRGGSWSNSAAQCRTAFRGYLQPDATNYCVGFRCVIGKP